MNAINVPEAERLIMRLPRLSASEAEQARKVSVKREPFLVTINGTDFRFSLQPATIAREARDSDTIFNASIGGHPAVLTLPPGFRHVLLQLVDEQLPYHNLGIEFEGLLLERLFEPLITALEPQWGTIQLGAQFTSDASMNSRQFAVRDGGGHHWLINLYANDNILHDIDAAWQAQPRSRVGSFDLTTNLALRVARTCLSWQELRAISPGDVIFADSRPSQPGTFLAVIENLAAFPGRYDDGKFLALSSPEHLAALPAAWAHLVEDLMDEETTGDVAIADLPVQLVFELGRKQIKLSELEAVSEGYVIEFDQPISQAVEIRASGQRIGHGELVLVQNRLGVRINALNNTDLDK